MNLREILHSLLTGRMGEHNLFGVAIKGGR